MQGKRGGLQELKGRIIRKKERSGREGEGIEIANFLFCQVRKKGGAYACISASQCHSLHTARFLSRSISHLYTHTHTSSSVFVL